MTRSESTATRKSSPEAPPDWMPFPDTAGEATLENWKATPYLNKYLSEDTASSLYYLDGLEIYKSTQGMYYYLDLSSCPQSAFCYGDTAPVSELSQLPDELMCNVRDLADADRAVTPYGFRLVQINYLDAEHVMFTLYSESLQHYSLVEYESFESISEDTLPQLAKQNPKPNTLVNPLRLLLDDDGNILRYEEADSDA